MCQCANLLICKYYDYVEITYSFSACIDRV